MTIQQALVKFREENNLDVNGGENDNFFELKFRLFTLTLPNFNFRKKIIHIHDIQHILYKCDTSWYGESFIAGWEIGSGIWKHFPINFISIWATGFSFLNYPKQVLNGYKSGLRVKGVIDLNISKKEILKLSVDEVNNRIQKEKKTPFNWFSFIFWILISEVVFLFPLLLIILFVY